MKVSTPDELIASFPHSSLPKVTGAPTFEDLKIIRCLLNTSATSVSSYEGGGLHGHLGIIMANDEYFAVTPYMFPAPANPGAMATIVAGMTETHIRETNRAHVEVMRVYHTYYNVEQAFK
jgi:hypothetical protein